MQTYIGNRWDNVFTADLDGAGSIAFGRADDDILHGSNATDYLFGGKGADMLFGNDGDDFLYGGRGADYLYGGDGDGTLQGGRGRDHFVFDLDNTGFDTITDFNAAKDEIDFMNVGDKKVSYDFDTGIISADGIAVAWIGQHQDFHL